MTPTEKRRISFSQAVVVTLAVGIVTVWGYLGGERPARDPENVVVAGVEDDAQGRALLRSGTNPSVGSTGSDLYAARGADYARVPSAEPSRSNAVGSRWTEASDTWAATGTGDGMHDGGRLRKHHRRERLTNGASDGTAPVAGLRGRRAERLALRNGRAPQAARNDKGGSNSSDTSKGNKAPQPAKQAVQSPPESQPNGDTPTDPTDEVIPIKAGDMELDAVNHAKVRRSGEVFMFANSSLSTNVDLPTDLQSLSIFAHADKAGGEWPHLLVSVNGEPVAEVIVNSTVDKKFYVPVHVDPGTAAISVSFINDFTDPTTLEDRNVYLSKIKVHVAR